MEAVEAFGGGKAALVDVATDGTGMRVACTRRGGALQVWDRDVATGAVTLTAQVGGDVAREAEGGAAVAAPAGGAPVGPPLAESLGRVVWAPAEHGAVVAAAEGGDVRLFAEEEAPRVSAGEEGTAPSSRPPRLWAAIGVLRACPEVTGASVLDIAFGPGHLGLLLAAVDDSGWVSVFRAPRVLDHRVWELHSRFRAFEGVGVPAAALCWCPRRQEYPFLAVSAGEAGEEVDMEIREAEDPGQGVARVLAGRVWACNFNEDRDWQAVADLRCTAGTSRGGNGNVSDGGSAGVGSARSDDDDDAGGSEEGRDVLCRSMAWSPRTGRKRELIAAAVGTGVQVWGFDLMLCNEETGLPEVQGVASFPACHDSLCRKVSWNAPGDTLASSGDDARIKLFMEDLEGGWECVQIFGTEDDDELEMG